MHKSVGPTYLYIYSYLYTNAPLPKNSTSVPLDLMKPFKTGRLKRFLQFSRKKSHLFLLFSSLCPYYLLSRLSVSVSFILCLSVFLSSVNHFFFSLYTNISLSLSLFLNLFLWLCLLCILLIFLCVFYLFIVNYTISKISYYSKVFVVGLYIKIVI